MKAGSNPVAGFIGVQQYLKINSKVQRPHARMLKLVQCDPSLMLWLKVVLRSFESFGEESKLFK